MKLLSLLLIFIFLTSITNAQNLGTVSGSVLKTKQPVEGANIALLRAKDSTTIKLTATNKEGHYSFEQIANGRYLVMVTSVGFAKAYSGLIEITPQLLNIQVAEMGLTSVSKEMAGVTVTSKRPMIENKIDRTVVNVDASVLNMGVSALEVLEKSPGVSVDRDGNISLKGKEGVLIMVDGRPTQLSGADLTNLLRNMSSNQLDQIEIMTNPPARYDAAGTSGIINIKTKKTITAGMNGSANATYSQGKYPKTAAGFNFNYRSGKVNVFTNLSHNYQKRYLTLNIDRNIFNSSTNALETILYQENHRITTSNSYNAKVGIDFLATSKTTFGAMVNYNSRPTTYINPSSIQILNSSKDLLSISRGTLDNKNDWNTLNTNLNFRHKLNAKGKEVTADVDFIKYGSSIDQFMVNSYTDAVGNSYRKSDTLLGSLPHDLNVYSARIDYINPLKKGVKLETGIKSSLVQTNNNAIYDSIMYGKLVHDYNRSNHFLYEENINAAYVNLSQSISKKLSAQFGMRVENTNATGKQKTTGENFRKTYVQLFPTAYFQYEINAKNNMGVNFGRRVNRPGYQNLNPFIRLINKYTYQRGNPDLKPAVNNNFELSHSWKNQITTTLNYSFVKDIISEITEQKGLESYNMPGNVSSLQQFGFSVNANTPITKWWTSNININLIHNNYKGMLDNASIDLSAMGLMLNASQQFKINKSLTAELNGVYRSGGAEGLTRIQPVGFIGAGLSKQILKNKAAIRLSARDIFHTQILKGSSQYGNVDYSISQVSETQVVAIGFTYNFSKGKKIAPIKRTAGSANEEQGRIN